VQGLVDQEGVLAADCGERTRDPGDPLGDRDAVEPGLVQPGGDGVERRFAQRRQQLLAGGK
jgi:hypothetical protein